MATATETIVPRLKQRYEEEIRSALKDELGLDSIMQVPRISKITLNMGVGEAKTDAKALDAAIEELTTIAGPARAGAPGAEVDRELQAARGDGGRRARDAARRAHVRVPRPARLDRAAAHPRLPGASSPDSFDGRGNYSLGIKEQIIFPEIDYDSVPAIRGLDIAITTTAETDEQGRALLRALGLPFATERRDS